MLKRVSSYVIMTLSIQVMCALTGSTTVHNGAHDAEPPPEAQDGKGRTHGTTGNKRTTGRSTSERPPTPVTLIDKAGNPLNLANRQDIRELNRQIEELKGLLREGRGQHVEDTERNTPKEAEPTTTTREVDDPNFAQVEETTAELQDAKQHNTGNITELVAKTQMALQLVIPINDGPESKNLASAVKKLITDMGTYHQIATSVLCMLDIITALTHPQHGLIAMLKTLPCRAAIAQARAIELVQERLWLLTPMQLTYQATVQQLTTAIQQSPFDGKPLIPSYLALTVFQSAATALGPGCTSLEATLRAILRQFETVINELKQSIEDTRRTISSAETPQSVKKILPEREKALQRKLDIFENVRKEIKDTGDSLARAARKNLGIIQGCLAKEKDTAIFDELTTDH